MQTKMKFIYGKALVLRGEVRKSGTSRGGLLQGSPFASIHMTQPSGILMLEALPLPPGVIENQNHSNEG